MKRALLLAALALSSGCDALPRDQAGTLERVRDYRVLRVGVVASGEAPAHQDKLAALVARVAATAGARPELHPDAAEPLLLQLEEGEVDLVVGEFDRSSPWYHRVHLLPPLAKEERAGSTIETTAAAPNGENAWIMLVEREARALADRP
jgi:hypothetical protein